MWLIVEDINCVAFIWPDGSTCIDDLANTTGLDADSDAIAKLAAFIVSSGMERPGPGGLLVTWADGELQSITGLNTKQVAAIADEAPNMLDRGQTVDRIAAVNKDLTTKTVVGLPLSWLNGHIAAKDIETVRDDVEVGGWRRKAITAAVTDPDKTIRENEARADRACRRVLRHMAHHGLINDDPGGIVVHIRNRQITAITGR